MQQSATYKHHACTLCIVCYCYYCINSESYRGNDEHWISSAHGLLFESYTLLINLSHFLHWRVQVSLQLQIQKNAKVGSRPNYACKLHQRKHVCLRSPQTRILHRHAQHHTTAATDYHLIDLQPVGARTASEVHNPKEED